MIVTKKDISSKINLLENEKKHTKQPKGNPGFLKLHLFLLTYWTKEQTSELSNNSAFLLINVPFLLVFATANSFAKKRRRRRKATMLFSIISFANCILSCRQELFFSFLRFSICALTILVKKGCTSIMTKLMLSTFFFSPLSNYSVLSVCVALMVNEKCAFLNNKKFEKNKLSFFVAVLCWI